MSVRPKNSHRYSALLIGLLLLFLWVPWWVEFAWGGVLIDIVVIATLLAAVYAASDRPFGYYVAMVLAAPALFSRALLALGEFHQMIGLSLICWGIFMTYVTVVILRDVMSTPLVNLDTIGGALCGYLMLGLTWSVFYALCEQVHPGSLIFSAAPGASHSVLADLSHSYPLFAYYSFTTLTTTGYGDVSPATMACRSLSVIEAIAGQFYIAVLVARLVALEIINSSRLPSHQDSAQP